ncbi:hypothetical protein GCM10022255_071670 [Dactylosporangium darangshiense]|uniref:Alpha/beta hydrolase n=1 Tax=Dactylosporangium darangshiense TaxID=579108 RepID=A0ABP8DIJ3_9ACTN
MSRRLGRITRLVVTAALLTAAAVVAPGAAGRAGAEPACSTHSTDQHAKPRPGTQPAIFVHGWTGNGDGQRATLRDAADKLQARTGNRITPYFFDYGDRATIWAGADDIAGCLARYINAVAEAAGGKVLVVAHSMGGIATLYAAARDGAGAHLAGVVTFDTPYLGSPFGDTGVAGFLQGLHQHGAGVVPPPGSDAQVCLAPHADGQTLARNCRFDLPPNLPASVPLTEIAGAVTVRRTIGPIHLYDIALGSDGVVPQSSSEGYLGIRDKAGRPTGVRVTPYDVRCTISSDSLKVAATAAGWTRNELAGLAAGAAQVYADHAAVDAVLSGSLNAGLAAYLLAATLTAPCSHINIYQQDGGLDAAASALDEYLDGLAGDQTLASLPGVCGTVTTVGGTTGMVSTFPGHDCGTALAIVKDFYAQLRKGGAYPYTQETQCAAEHCTYLPGNLLFAGPGQRWSCWYAYPVKTHYADCQLLAWHGDGSPWNTPASEAITVDIPLAAPAGPIPPCDPALLAAALRTVLGGSSGRYLTGHACYSGYATGTVDGGTAVGFWASGGAWRAKVLGTDLSYEALSASGIPVVALRGLLAAQRLGFERVPV